MAAPWTWLPDQALVAPEVLGRVDAALEAWSGRWFRRYGLTRRRTHFDALQAAPVVIASDRFVVRADDAALRSLAAEAVEPDLARLELTEDDERVIDGFRQTLLHDLVAGLEAALPAGAPAEVGSEFNSGPVAFELAAEDGRRVAVIETSRAALAAVRLAAMAPPGSRGDLVALRAALAEVPVQLSITLGSAALPVPEARRLAAGDIVILDRRLDEAFDVACGSAVLACARMTDSASPRSLRLEAA